MVPEEEKTPLEIFLEMLELKKSRFEETRNIWDEYAYNKLKEWGETHFDLEGQELPTEPVTSDLTIQVSPPEAIEAAGTWNVKPNLFDMPPQIVLNQMGDPEAGLDLYASRSNGAFLVQNQEDTAQYWLANTEAVAAQYGISQRIVRMAAYNMAGLRYLLPTSNWGGARGFDNFAVEPEIPFNEAENGLWVGNWKALHMRPGMNYVTLDYFQNPEALGGQRIRVDKNGKHRIVIVPGRPQWVIPNLMGRFNSAIFKSRAVSVARSLAHKIDAGQAAPVAGYEPVEITGSDRTAWYAANGEATDQTKQPEFSPGREI